VTDPNQPGPAQAPSSGGDHPAEFAGEKTKKFDHGRPRVYFSSNFLKNHVDTGNELPKKRAEIVFQRRGRTISTVIYLTPSELVTLAAEVFNKQDKFAAAPDGIFTTDQPYELWSRGDDDGTDKQRATSINSTFKYAVQKNSDGVYVIYHFHGK
jgi:hypothetical protein